MTPTKIGSIKVKIVEYTHNSFVSKDTKETVQFDTLIVRTQNGLVKIKPARDFNFEKYVDQDVSLDLAMDIFNMKASLMAIGVNGKTSVDQLGK